MKKIVKLPLIIVAVVAISTACICNSCMVNAEEITTRATSLKSHNPISINGNSEFTPENGVTSGSGTPSDPYIVEGWSISASSADGIYISDTDVYFIIRDCTIYNGGYKNNNNEGIEFYKVTNGKIDSVVLCQNDEGILLHCSSNNNITNCKVYNNDDGIYVYYSSNSNNITNCKVYNNDYGT